MARLLQAFEPQLIYPHFGLTTGLQKEQAHQGRADTEGLVTPSAVTTTTRLRSVFSTEDLMSK